MKKPFGIKNQPDPIIATEVTSKNYVENLLNDPSLMSLIRTLT